MTNHFNSEFYVTTATVIPVLFLAIAVQGPTYERMLESAIRSILRFRHDPNFLDFLIAVVSALLVTIALLIVVAGGLGEAIAMHALYTEHDESGRRSMVYLTAIFLIIVAVGAPLLSYTRTILGIFLMGSLAKWKDQEAKAAKTFAIMGSLEPKIKPKSEADTTDTTDTTDTD